MTQPPAPDAVPKVAVDGEGIQPVGGALDLERGRADPEVER